MTEHNENRLREVLTKAKQMSLSTSKWVESTYLVKKAGSFYYTLMQHGKPILSIIDGELHKFAVDTELEYHHIIKEVFPEAFKDDKEFEETKDVEENEVTKEDKPKKQRKSVRKTDSEGNDGVGVQSSKEVV